MTRHEGNLLVRKLAKFEKERENIYVITFCFATFIACNDHLTYIVLPGIRLHPLQRTSASMDALHPLISKLQLRFTVLPESIASSE
jgi:hypothetical protein